MSLFYDYWEYTDCINSGNQLLIEDALTQILQKDGFKRISELPEASPDELRAESYLLSEQLLRNFLIIGLYPGAPGWTIMKTRPHEFMCRRGSNSLKPRLSELSVAINCKAFHWGVYCDSWGILMEVNNIGEVFVSGCHPKEEKEDGHLFYQEEINYSEAWKFHLMDIPEDIREAIRPETEEESKERFKRLDKLEALEQRLIELETLEKNEIDASLKNQFQALLRYEIDDLHQAWIDTHNEVEELLTGDSTIADRVLSRFVGGGSRYWHIGGEYRTIYSKKEQIKTDGGKLLYFQMPEHYQQLNYRTNIASKY
jgi:hypothetical protein